MQISKKLHSGDLLILKANFDLINDKKAPNVGNIGLKEHLAVNWFKNISRQIGHCIPSLVEFHEQNLMELKLRTNFH